VASASSNSLTQDRLESLRIELGQRFAGQPTIRSAIVFVLDAIIDGWSNHNGMSPDSFIRLNDAMISPLEALRSVDPANASYTSDQMCRAWEKVRQDLVWL
jgi:hypothetical protein